MSKIRFVAISTMALVTVCAAGARAADISATKIQIKENADPAKRQIQVQSVDTAILFANADDPSVNKASLHVYSSTDDFCIKLPSGTDWTSNGSQWKYKNKLTHNLALVKDKKLIVKIKSGVAYSLNEPSQMDVNVQVQFGSGTRYCLRCNGAEVIQNDTKKYFGKQCAAVACDPEVDPCDPLVTTTTTTTTTTSTTTTTCPPIPPVSPTILKGSLTATKGRFNYSLNLGLPGANAACNAAFLGTHACSYPELQAAAAACETVGLKDTALNTVTSFWQISANSLTTPDLQQCLDDILGGSNKNWEYATSHTASRGHHIPLNNVNGALGTPTGPLQCNGIGNDSWVGCCQ